MGKGKAMPMPEIDMEYLTFYINEDDGNLYRGHLEILSRAIHKLLIESDYPMDKDCYEVLCGLDSIRDTFTTIFGLPHLL